MLQCHALPYIAMLYFGINRSTVFATSNSIALLACNKIHDKIPDSNIKDQKNKAVPIGSLETLKVLASGTLRKKPFFLGNLD
jgi:hypothetical protein